MVIDMHVHTSEGSIDGRVSIFDTVNKLKELGFNGVLITDHDSYDGYNTWKESGRTDFKVFRGIEYDTIDAGHMIVIVPESIQDSEALSIFKLRGLQVQKLIEIVHKLGGVVGPAHPYGYKRLGIGNNPRWFNRLDIFKEFDFVEGFNSCCDVISNSLAMAVAKNFGIICTAGSDSHKKDCIGKARTTFSKEINNTDELIEAIKNCEIQEINGEYYRSMMIRHSNMFSVGLCGFYAMNRVVSMFNSRRRAELSSLILNS